MPISLDAEIKLGNSKIDAASEVFDLAITSEIDSPDTCAITLTKSGADKWATSLTLTDPISVKLAHTGDDKDFAFLGEITGLEPTFGPRTAKTGTMIVRGLNAMHELSRGKHSYAYSKPDGSYTDRQIFDDLLKRRQPKTLKLEDEPTGQSAPPTVSYRHVYQHNQTDLEFLRLRAARIGCYILVQDKKVVFRKRDATKSGLKLVYGSAQQLVVGDTSQTIALTSFASRVSTANQVTQVEVRCFMPDQRQEMVCVAPSSDKEWKKLAAKTGIDLTKLKHADAVAVRVDIPFSSKAEGDAIAMSLLNERLLDFVTAEGSVPGDARLKPGIVVEIATGQDFVDGMYFITQVRHTFNASHTPFRTDFIARRDSIETSSKKPAA